jgi:single-strand DNA-binding protein
MSADNTITVSGRLGGDPEIRWTTSGRAVASANLAVDHRFQRNGEWESETSWLNVQAWGELGEHLASSCSKGDRIIVVGRMSQRSYETREGEKRYAYEIIADDIGPSLKWAECSVERIQRDGSTGGTTGGRAPAYTEEEEPFLRDANLTDL